MSKKPKIENVHLQTYTKQKNSVNDKISTIIDNLINLITVTKHIRIDTFLQLHIIK